MNFREVLPWNWSKKEPAPTTPEPWSPFLARDFGDVFELLSRRPFEGMPALAGGADAGAPFLPALDAQETDDEIRIDIELPGLSEKDIELTIHEDHLTIQGEKQQERRQGPDGDADHQWVERRFGSFRRVVPLPPDIEVEKIDAHFEKGMLHISIPRRAGAAPERRTIPIQGE